MGSERSAEALLADLKSDDPRVAATALRDVLALQLLSEADGSKAASVAKVLRDVQKDLAEMKPVEGSATDEIAARRAARRSTSVPDSAAGSDDGGGGRSGRARSKRGTGS